MTNDRGFTLIEFLVVIGFIGILGTVATANLLRSRRAANEASAISSIRTIGTAQAAFRTSAGSGRHFAQDLPALSKGKFVDEGLGSGLKCGYSFTTSGTAASFDGPSYFNTTATPLSTGSIGTGNRSFYSNEKLVIYELPGPVPPGGTSSTVRVAQTGVPIP
jgi:type IV pilus assembly protein PilA